MSVLHSKKSQWLKLSCVGFVFLTGCAHVKPANIDNANLPAAAAAGDVPSPKTLTQVLQQDISLENASSEPSLSESSPKSQSVVMAENGEIIVQGIKLKNTRFDIPILVNSRVESWINYFCGRGRKYFGKYLERSEYFVPYIVPILKQNGLPEDLVYLAMIESGFNNLARSRAKAVGPWQFISATGKRYGLKVNWWVDQRRATDLSTRAAVGYLKDLYGIFKSWELSAAAYNAGEAKVARAIRRFGSKDFWVISRHRFLKPETRDYVPKIIAAAIIAKNRTQFGFPDSNLKPGADEAVAGDGEIVKLVKSDKAVEDKEYKAEKEADISKVVVTEDDEDFASDDEQSPEVTTATLNVPLDPPKDPVPVPMAPPLAKPVPAPHVSKTGEVQGEDLAEFDVQSPADLLQVARAAGLSYQTVKALNPEILRWCTPPTVGTYRVKLPAFTRDKFLSTYNHQAFPRKVQFMIYKVRRGDTLARIAQHFGIKVDPMSDLNGVPPRMQLKSGSKILLPMPNDRSRTFASLEVRDPPEKRKHRHNRRFRHGQKYYKVTYKRRESARSVGSRAHREHEG